MPANKDSTSAKGPKTSKGAAKSVGPYEQTETQGAKKARPSTDKQLASAIERSLGAGEGESGLPSSRMRTCRGEKCI